MGYNYPEEQTRLNIVRLLKHCYPDFRKLGLAKANKTKPIVSENFSKLSAEKIERLEMILKGLQSKGYLLFASHEQRFEIAVVKQVELVNQLANIRFQKAFDGYIKSTNALINSTTNDSFDAKANTFLQQYDRKTSNHTASAANIENSVESSPKPSTSHPTSKPSSI